MRGQQPIVIEDFRGLFDRGPNENCPPNYFIDCNNLEFVFKGFQTRGEFVLQTAFSAISCNILGLQAFPRLDGTTRRMLLVREVGGGDPVKLYDLDHSAPPFLVGTYSTAVDGVSILPMFDRLYIAPLGTKNAHLASTVVQVYDGISAARDAAGLAPSGATMGASEPGAGNISAGIHLYAIAFETPSGFITKAGPAVWTSFTSTGSKNINLTGILTGPAGTTKRHILATKRIPIYGPPQENFELFFVEEIADNVTTTLTFDFFDTELVDSADYLLDQKETIPAGPLFSIGNSMGVAGYSLVGRIPTDDKGILMDHRSIALISKAVEVEAFSSDEGFIVANPSLGGPLRNGLDLNGTLFLFKDSLTLAVQPNLDVAPSEWGSPGVIDSIIGTTPFGIATFMGSPFVINGGVFILTRFGLQHFTGNYNKISWAIEERFNAISTFDFNTAVAVVDPVHSRVYMLLPSVAGYPDTFFVADYKDGFAPEQIRWTPWTSTNQVLRALMTDRDGAIQITNTSEQIVKWVERTGAVTEVIPSYAESAKLRFTNLGHICNFQMILLGAKGSGDLELDWFSKDSVISDTATVDVILSAAPDKFIKRLANFTSTMASLKMSMTGAGGRYMNINSLIVYGHVEAEEYPE